MSGTQNNVGIKRSMKPTTDEFAGPSPAEYNRNHGRRPSAPTKGSGDRTKTYEALLRPGNAVD